MNIVHIGRLAVGRGRPCIIVPLTSSDLSGLCEEAERLSSLPADMAEWRVDMFCGSSGVD